MRTRLPSLLMQLVLLVCILAASELGWRTFALTKFLEFQAQSAPPSAESVSTRLAPFLTSRDAEKIYATVQSQYVELTQQHDLLVGLAGSARQTTAIALGAALLASLLSCLALWLLRPTKAISS
jgi:hypothetical protein